MVPGEVSRLWRLQVTVHSSLGGHLQMVVLMDPMEDPDDILRAHRSREKSYLFDVAFDFTATQVRGNMAWKQRKVSPHFPQQGSILRGLCSLTFAQGPTLCRFACL